MGRLTKQELLNLLTEVVNNLAGSTEVIDHIIKVTVGIEGEDLVDITNIGMKQLREQWLPENLDPNLEHDILASLNAAFITGTLYGAEITKNN